MWLDILLFVIGIPVGALSGWLFQRWVDVAEDREVWCDVQMTSIRTDVHSELGSQLTWVAEDGTTVTDPWIADLYLWCAGKHDIPNDAFNNGESLVVDLCVPIISKLEAEDLRQVESVTYIVDPTGQLVVEPSLLRKRMLIHHRYIVEGMPSRTISNPIVDVEEVRSFYAEWRKKTPGKIARRVVGIVMGVLGALGFAAIPFIGAVYYSKTGKRLDWPDWTNWLAILALAFFLIGTAVAIFGEGPTRKASRALRLLNGGLTVPMIEPSRSEQVIQRSGV